MSIKSFKVVLLFLLLLSISSCEKNKETGDKDYKSFNLYNNEWKSKRITHSIDFLSYTATEVPLQYYILKNAPENSVKRDSIILASSKERIVEIEFEHQNKEDLLLEEFTNKSYEESVKYMSFSIEKDFKVVTESNDTIKCNGVLFERNFKVAPFKRLLLYFNNIDPNETIKLIYNDELFGNGIMEFEFIEKPLKL
ncbi:MAG: hypothetical protein ACX93I_10070 [Winogradskyella sp.]